MDPAYPYSVTIPDTTAEVVPWGDGGAIDVLDFNKIQHRVRFAGIDAPEHNQDFGKSVKENMPNLVFGKSVSIPDSKKEQIRDSEI